LTVQNHTQFIKADGVWFGDPELDEDLTKIQRFARDSLDDDVYNTSWTLEGRLGMLDAVYTGAFNKHEFEQRADYTDYGFIGPFIPYYTCDYYNVYNPGGNDGPTGNCGDPRLFADIENETDTFTHELRFTPDVLSVTGGIRHYDVKVDFVGSSNNVTAFFGGADNDRGFNLDDIFDGDGTFIALNGPNGNRNANGLDTTTALPFDPIDKAVSKGQIFKGNLTWTPDDEKLFYVILTVLQLLHRLCSLSLIQTS